MSKYLYDLIGRRMPELHGRVVFHTAAAPETFFELQNNDAGQVAVTGDSTLSCAQGLHWYWKHVCHGHLSWCGSRAGRFTPLAGSAPIRMAMPRSETVYLNYCTFGYSACWWDWERWEWELDFMALNGVSMPLFTVGLEGVWFEALLRIGFGESEALEYLSGPAFLAWQWMGNIQSHCGPLPRSWIDGHVALGRRILRRMLGFGMTPIQSFFSGVVPRLFAEKFPGARVTAQPGWCNFPGTLMLDPLDPWFRRFGLTFMTVQRELFGLHGCYAADPFHETEMSGDDPAYLARVGKSIEALLIETDPDGCWVMQGWSLRREIVQAVSKNRLLILDLAGTEYGKHDGFWGYDFIAGQLHNFGGRTNLHGDLALIAANPAASLRREYPRQMRGTGLFMEGIGQNPVFYDLVCDMNLRHDTVDIRQWLREYAVRRYGALLPEFERAWELLLKSAYRQGTNAVESSSIVAARPALEVKKSGPNEGFRRDYENRDLFAAWRALLDGAGVVAEISEGLRFDLIDVGRQALSNLAREIQQKTTAAFAARDRACFRRMSQRFLCLLDDIDMLLGYSEHYRLDRWMADAKHWARNPEEEALYARNASYLVTLWGPEEAPEIFDYAWREWHGLIKGFYRERWRKFFDFLQDRLERGEAYDEDRLPQAYGREAWRANDFYRDLAAWETAWRGEAHSASDHAFAWEKINAVYERWSQSYEVPADSSGFSHVRVDFGGWCPVRQETLAGYPDAGRG